MNRARSQWARPSIGMALGGFLFLVLGCVAEVDPASIQGVAISAGRYEIQNGLPTLVEATSEIGCEPGTIFGVDYRLDVAPGQGGVVPVEFRWSHPELNVPSKKLWGTESPARMPNPSLPKGQTSIFGQALWTLEHLDERVSGKFEFIIRTLPDRRQILTKSFDVKGC